MMYGTTTINSLHNLYYQLYYVLYSQSKMKLKNHNKSEAKQKHLFFCTLIRPNNKILFKKPHNTSLTLHQCMFCAFLMRCSWRVMRGVPQEGTSGTEPRLHYWGSLPRPSLNVTGPGRWGKGGGEQGGERGRGEQGGGKCEFRNQGENLKGIRILYIKEED